MALQALNFDFKGFIEAEGLFPYRNLFASQSPALVGKPLCELLSKMDKAEYDLLVLENREITLLQEDSDQWFNRLIVIDLVALAYVGITYLFGEKLRLIEIDNPFKKVFHIAGIFAFVICLATVYAPMYAGDDRRYKMSTLSQKRTDRLQEKFDRIRAEHRALKEANSTSPERTQLRDAKRFFQSQLEKIAKRTQS